MELLLFLIWDVQKKVENVKKDLFDDKYAIDVSVDNKEHSFNEIRPIIKAFVDINQSMSIDEVSTVLSKLGTDRLF